MNYGRAGFSAGDASWRRGGAALDIGGAVIEYNAGSAEAVDSRAVGAACCPSPSPQSEPRLRRGRTFERLRAGVRTAFLLVLFTLATLAGLAPGAAHAQSVPVVTVSLESENINEGDTMRVTVTAAPAPAADLSVNLRFVPSGHDYIGLGGPVDHATAITAGSTTGDTVEAPAMEDSAYRGDGTVTISIQPGTGYTVGSPGSVTLNIADNEAPPPPTLPVVTPVVTVSLESENINEGDTMRVTVTAAPAPAQDIRVNLRFVTSGHDYFSIGSPFNHTVDVPAGSTTGDTVEAEASEDTAQAGDSTVTISIQSGTGYTVGSPSSATLNIADNDAPNNAPTFAGAPFSFTLAENADGSTTAVAVGTAAATDADSDSLSYSITAGNGAGKFAIVSSTGAITYVGSGENYESTADPANAFTLTVRADDSNGGTADATVVVAVTDQTETPGDPGAPTLSSATANSLTVQWTASTNTGPAVTYDVEYRQGTSGSWSDGPQDETGTSATITSLMANTGYQVRVQADNGEGQSMWVQSATTLSTVPNQASITWTGSFTESRANDGSVEGSVTATLTGDMFASQADVGAGLTVDNVPASLQASFRRDSDTEVTLFFASGRADQHANADDVTNMRAVFANRAFVGRDASRVANSTKNDIAIDFNDPAPAPDAPAAPSVTDITARGFTVSWTAPNDNGATISKYEYQYFASPDSVNVLVGPAEVTTTSVQVVSPNTGAAPQPYDVQVRAYNGAWSAWSPKTRLNVPPASRPDAPAAPTVTRTSGSETTSLDVSWTAPANDGGADIDDYDLQYRVKEPEGPIQSPSQGSSTTATIASLQPGTTYRVRVRAENDAGNGSWSDWGEETTQPAAPGAPTVTGESGTSLTVTWNAVTGADTYDVRYREGTSGSWTNPTGLSNDTTETISGLMQNTSYQVQVRARKGAVGSAWSASGTGSTRAFTGSIAWTGSFTEAGANDGSVTGSVTATLTGETFNSNVATLSQSINVSNLPSGLTRSSEVNTALTVVTFRLTGNADSHLDADDVSDLSFEFGDNAFTGGDADDVANAASPNIAIDFDDPTPTASIAWTGSFRETDANDGSVEGTLTATLTGDTFTTAAEGFAGTLSVENLPYRLSLTITPVSSTRVTLTLDDTADSHADADDVSDLTIILGDDEFTGGQAILVANSRKDDIAIDFIDPYAVPDAPATPTFTNVGRDRLHGELDRAGLGRRPGDREATTLRYRDGTSGNWTERVLQGPDPPPPARTRIDGPDHIRTPYEVQVKAFNAEQRRLPSAWSSSGSVKRPPPRACRTRRRGRRCGRPRAAGRAWTCRGGRRRTTAARRSRTTTCSTAWSATASFTASRP